MIDRSTTKTSGQTAKAGLYLICFVSVLLSLPYIQTLGDDTFIYMRAIKNLINTGRFEYNVGEPCYIFTSVTWFLSWAGTTALLKNIDLARYILSFLFNIFAFVMVFLAGKKLIRNRIVLLIVLATVFLDPFYLRWFWAGWEVSLKIAVAAMTIFALLSLEPRSSLKAYFLAGICAGLGILTRPEMMFLAAYGLVFILVKFPKKPRHVLLYVVGLGVLTVPWFVYAYETFGRLIPHTVLIKTGAKVTFTWFLHSGIRLTEIVGVPQLSLILLLVIAFYALRKNAVVVAGSKTLVSRYLNGTHKRRIADYLLVAIWGCTMFCFLIAGSSIVSIYTSLFVPFLALTLGSAVDFAVYSQRANWLNNKALLVFIGIAMVISIGVQSRIFYRFSYFNPDYRLGTDKNFVEFALKVREMTEPTDTIGLWELGVVGLYTDRYIIDFAGLATPEIVEYRRKYGKEYLARFLEETGRYPDFVFKQIKFENAQDFARSTVASETISLHGHEYKPVYSREVHRVGGGRARGSVDLMVLYKKM